MLYSQTADSYTKHVIMKSMFVMAYQDAEAGALLDTLIQWIAGAVNKGHLGSSGVSLRNLAYKGTKTLGEAIKELELYEDDDGWHTKLHDNL